MALSTEKHEAAKILIVDDEKPIRQLIATILENSGFVVKSVEDSKSAKIELEENKYDMMVTDMYMPGESGLDLIRFVKNHYPETGCVIVTSESDVEMGREILKTGVYGYIIKPFDRSTLLISLQNALEHLRLDLEMQSIKNVLEKEAWERTERLNIIMDNLKVGIILFSPDMTIIEINRQVREWFPHITLSEKRYCYHLLPRTHQESVCEDCPIIDSLNQRKTTENIKKITTQSGKRDFRIVASPIYDKEHKIIGGVGLYEDITEKNIMEQELSQAQKIEAIGQLAAGITHEINTPVQYVGHNLSFLQDAFQDLSGVLDSCQKVCSVTQEDPKVSLEMIPRLRSAMEDADVEYLLDEIPKTIEQGLEGIHRVEKIVRAMKEFSHPGTDEKINVNINELLDSTLTLSRNQWKYVAELETDFNEDLPLIPCLPGEINQVFLNLIVNAAHAIEDKQKDGTSLGRLSVKTDIKEKMVQICISDTGCGIPEAIQDRIFDAFFTTKAVGKGTGQGLAIARRVIIEKHQGNINFETIPGEGTTFIVELPTG